MAKGGMSVKKAGKRGGERGGQTTKERYGSEFYREIGRRGGETVRQTAGASSTRTSDARADKRSAS